MSTESVMPSNHLIVCRPLLLLTSILPSIRVFSNELVLPIRWPKYWSFFSASASVLPMNIQGWFPLGLTALISLRYKSINSSHSYSASCHPEVPSQLFRIPSLIQLGFSSWLGASPRLCEVWMLRKLPCLGCSSENLGVFDKLLAKEEDAPANLLQALSMFTGIIPGVINMLFTRNPVFNLLLGL